MQRKKNLKCLYVVLCPLAMLACVYIQLEISSVYTSIGEWWHFMSTKFALLNLATIAILFLVLFAVTNRIWLSGMIFCCVYFIVAVVNHYCIVWHGMPFTIMELKNVATAVNVLGAYRITLDLKSCCILGLWILEMGICLTARRLEKAVLSKRGWKFILLQDIGFVLFGAGVFWFGYFSSNPVKPRITIGWTWSEAYREYGYIACQIEVISSFQNALVKPEEYSEEKVMEIKMGGLFRGIIRRMSY